MGSRRPLAWAWAVWACAGWTAWTVAPAPLAAQVVRHERPFYGRTLLWGSGMIVTPTAAVPPGKITLAGNANAYFWEAGEGGSTEIDEGGMIAVSLLGVFEGGLSVYTTEDAGLFGKLRLVHGGPEFPSLAVGVLNVTGRKVGRFGNPDPFYDSFTERTVFYGVATYVVEPTEEQRPIWLELSLGWGSGFFVEDNVVAGREAFPDSLNVPTSGVFGSLAVDFKIGRDHFLRFMVEHDAWNVNAGAMLMVGGAELSAGVLALAGTTNGDTRSENQLRPYVALTLDATVLRRWPLIWKGHGP
mgnify:CR=1 FL=1